MLPALAVLAIGEHLAVLHALPTNQLHSSRTDPISVDDCGERRQLRSTPKLFFLRPQAPWVWFVMHYLVYNIFACTAWPHVQV